MSARDGRDADADADERRPRDMTTRDARRLRAYLRDEARRALGREARRATRDAEADARRGRGRAEATRGDDARNAYGWTIRIGADASALMTLALVVVVASVVASCGGDDIRDACVVACALAFASTFVHASYQRVTRE